MAEKCLPQDLNLIFGFNFPQISFPTSRPQKQRRKKKKKEKIVTIDVQVF